jgi:tRNA(fMet)-specific endonuclease VapC
MKIHILDTDHFSLFERGQPRVVARFRATPSHEIGITVITAEEKLRGRLAYIRQTLSKPSSPDKQYEAYRWFRESVETIRDFSILDYNAKADLVFQALRKQKIHVGTQDLRIAAITLSVGGILVTKNAQDFSQIPGLTFEDWTQ